jgi:hypothetical protein
MYYISNVLLIVLTNLKRVASKTEHCNIYTINLIECYSSLIVNVLQIPLINEITVREVKEIETRNYRKHFQRTNFHFMLQKAYKSKILLFHHSVSLISRLFIPNYFSFFRFFFVYFLL